MADQQFFKRYRMEINFEQTPLPPAKLPVGYHWREWRQTDVERHALTKFRSFRDEVDSEVFACLGEYYGCLRLMSDIASQETFLSRATWLVEWSDGDHLPQDCGTIQGIGLTDHSGSIQNIGVVPEHRGFGLGRALVLKSLSGFAEAGMKRVVLEVTANNVVAVGLYQSLGFRVLRTMYRVVPIEASIH
ncbi:GNAT family N-acetyltransferase [Schlesneria sp. T3-172]|uniref:GNAT family N-acetyltransferase n=1 Tax=Schlesneria sphaerica TaxID=3373610 RepID=UPI0037C68BB5